MSGLARESCSLALIEAARMLRDRLDTLTFSAPVTHVYNPLRYARAGYELYLTKYAARPKRVIFLGMNPGPFGMAQTGVPFGEVRAVREWLKIEASISPPPIEHPRRRVTGFDCPRSEISGQRLWGLFARRFGSAETFFDDHVVLNYCPLSFLEQSGRNRTPDKLRASERDPLFAACDAHLREAVRILRPDWLIGIGHFAESRAKSVFRDGAIRIDRIGHPSPANPSANRGWAERVSNELRRLGLWR